MRDPTAHGLKDDVTSPSTETFALRSMDEWQRNSTGKKMTSLGYIDLSLNSTVPGPVHLDQAPSCLSIEHIWLLWFPLVLTQSIAAFSHHFQQSWVTSNIWPQHRSLLYRSSAWPFSSSRFSQRALSHSPLFLPLQTCFQTGVSPSVSPQWALRREMHG